MLDFVELEKLRTRKKLSSSLHVGISEMRHQKHVHEMSTGGDGDNTSH